MSTYRILCTPGEPAGIGPELLIKAAQNTLPFQFVAVADPDLLRYYSEQLQLPLCIETIDVQTTPSILPAQHLACVPIKMQESVVAGQLNINNAAYTVACLQKANDLCLSKHAHAVVTGPVQKSVINESGLAFSGHTEFFAQQSNTDKVVMMLATKGLRVALATTHLPLKDVSSAITQQSLTEVLRILLDELRVKFGLVSPRVLVCGLNPHAGEDGHLGMEEITTITPVLEKFRAEGWDLVGPLPADTLFTPKHLEQADAVLAMYHDQGLPVLKYKGFGEAVNVTLGLPYIRTSVDHGTALDLAGKGVADTGSMAVALDLAFELAQNSRL